MCWLKSGESSGVDSLWHGELSTDGCTFINEESHQLLELMKERETDVLKSIQELDKLLILL